MDTKNHKFVALDGMRGLLALSVALFHLQLLGHFYDFPLVRNSATAVDFFFVLSGFVITHASLSQLNSWKGGINFIIRRFGRIWPLHVTILGVFVFFELLKLMGSHHGVIKGKYEAFDPGSAYSLLALFSNLTLTQAMHIHDKFTWNSPSWSISAEFWAYILFGILVITARRWLVPVSVFLIAISMISLAGLVNYMSAAGYDYGFLRCVAGFFTGYLVYRVWQISKKRELTEVLYPNLTEALCVALMVMFPLVTADNRFSILIPLNIAIPVYVFANQQGFVSRFLSTKPLQIIGAWSYGIYMVHGLLLFFMKRGFYTLEKIMNRDLRVMHVSPNQDPAELFYIVNPWVMDLMAIVYLCGVIALAGLAYRFVEVPSRSWFNNLAKRLVK